MGKKANHIAFLLDETGSMYGCKDDTIGGFNSFLKDQQESKHKIKFSLTKFNSHKVEKTYKDIDVNDVAPLSDGNYYPSHMTPLWDAIGTTIGELNRRKNVLFVVLTDGQENCSKEFSSTSVKKMIKKKEEKHNWKFMFLGADLSDFDDAFRVGIHHVFTVDKTNMRKAYASLSDTVETYCSTGKVEYDNT